MERSNAEIVRLLRSLLEVVDNLERALDAWRADAGSSEAFAEGVRGIHRQLNDLLYRYDVRPFSSEGTAFDPSRHEAVGQLRTEAVPPRHVARELRRGYLQNDLLFRAAQVLVATEPTAEQPAVSPPGSGGFREVARAPERSAPNRPPWLLEPPRTTPVAVYCVGRVAGAPDLDEGQRRARNEALRELVSRLPQLAPEDVLVQALHELGRSLEGRSDEDLWGALASRLPEIERWVDDFYWEQVKSEIRGRAYDLAILLQVPRERLGVLLLPSELVLERWGGLELIDLGALLLALGGVTGAMVVSTQHGGLGARAGFKPGDVITRVGMRPIEDAASARRLMNLSAKQRRPFEVEFSRAFGPMMMLRVDPTLRI